MAEAWLSTSAAELGRRIGTSRIDPRDLAEAFLEAAAAHPLADRIYARLMPERARDEAAAAAERAAAGKRLGPLDGVPVSWKDLYDTAGVATESGSRLLAGRVPDVDAPVVKRGVEAGLVALGKTHLSELAFSGLGVNPMTATAPNVHDPALAPGGSSSGAAASVAFGLAAASVGSDTGGSCRIPAAWNDLVGLKTTWGLIPMVGAVPLARSLDSCGPLTRTVEDAALMHAILAAEPVEGLDEAQPADEKLYLAETLVLDGMDDAIEQGWADAIDRLGQAGVPMTSGPVHEFRTCMEVAAEISAVVNTEAWREWGRVIEQQPGTMWAPIEARFRSGESGSKETDDRALARYTQIRDELTDRIERQGLIAMPAVPCLAPPIERLMADADYYAERNLLALRNTRLANMLGLCSITVPTGIPMVGVMLFGRPGDDARILRAARAIERALG